MKKSILILIFFSFTSLQGQINEVQKLESLCKIWGFLKYYHPEVASGKFNWDEELFNIMPKVRQANDINELSSIYIQWIEDLGEIQPCKNCDKSPKKEYHDKNLNLSWTQDENYFSTELSKKLKFIEENRYQKEHYYIRQSNVGNVSVSNEPEYTFNEVPNESYRLLALFKYWNIIAYFYPYKYMIDQNWDNVLLEMIPKFHKASSIKEYHSAIKELVAKLDDSHAWIKFTNHKNKFLPVKLKNIKDSIVISGYYNDSIARTNNLIKGDIIIEVEDIAVENEIKKNYKYISGSNKNSKLKNIYYDILSGSDSVVNITIKRGDSIIVQRVKRYYYEEFYSNKESSKVDLNKPTDVTYINLSSLLTIDISEIFNSLEDKKAIIIDLRIYPDLIYRLISRHINSERRDFAAIYSPDLSYPGRFIKEENLKTGTKNKNAYKGKVILLVDDDTMSRAEFTAMAFQTADNVITIGNQTVGSDGDVTIFDFLGGYETSMTGIGVYYPDGTPTQRTGVKIDIIVTPSIEGTKEGRDEILEAALEYINMTKLNKQ